MEADLRTLRERLAEISDLGRMLLLAGWDQRVMMPALGGPARAEAIATLGRVAHEKFVDAEIGNLLDRLRPYEESLEYESDDASLIRVTRRDWEKARRDPDRPALGDAAGRGAGTPGLGRRQGRTTTSPSFLPTLERNLELKKRYAECFEWDDSPYTPLLDDFEPFMESTEVAEIFDTIRPVLTELVREAPAVDGVVPGHVVRARAPA